MIAEAKAKCDQELKAFLALADAALASEDSPSAAEVVACVRELLECTVEDVASGRFRDSVNRMRKMHQAKVRAGGPSRAPSALTKLLLVASRVTRLVEFMAAAAEAEAEETVAASRARVTRSVSGE
jgi:hypothetical protein